VELWEIIRDQNAQLNTGRDKVFEQVRTRLRGIHSGQNGNLQWARLEVESRIPPGFHPDDWLQWLEGLVEGGMVTPSGYWAPAYRSPKNSPLIRSFLRSIRAGGGAPRFVLKSGTSDMNTVAQTWDCPLVAYGPGDSNLDHTPNEHIFLSEYQKSVDILKAAILDLTGS
jgi:LysW-gamma-L-lysine carboxypeptidase